MSRTMAASRVQEPIFCKISWILGVFRQQPPIQGNVFGRGLMKKNQGIADVIGLINSSGDLFHHFLLGSMPIPGGASIRQIGTTPSLYVQKPHFLQ